MDRKLFVLLLTGFIICEFFAPSVSAIKETEVKKSRGLIKRLCCIGNAEMDEAKTLLESNDFRTTSQYIHNSEPIAQPASATPTPIARQASKSASAPQSSAQAPRLAAVPELSTQTSIPKVVKHTTKLEAISFKANRGKFEIGSSSKEGGSSSTTLQNHLQQS